MIPISVRMTGWMRYRDETVADFSGGNLIAICGENGAGKSSIFDAITFALYGQHRLGKQNAKDLISEDRDRLSVEFEFEADGERYLVRRSRGEKLGERDQSLWVADGAGEWAQVAGTEKEDALDRAIANVVRLSYEAFTASFLLQQGEATAFIDADPKPRFEIISSLIGLKEYERLERATREATRTEKDRTDWINDKLAEIGDIDEAAIATMRTAVEIAAKEDADATLLLEKAKAMFADAQRYTRLAAEIAKLDATIARAQELLADREQIEHDAHLYETLTQALDGVTRIQRALADAKRAESAAESARVQSAKIDLVALTAAHKTAAEASKAAAKQQQSAERAHAAASAAERDAGAFAQLAGSVLEGRTNVAGFDERIKQIDAELKQLSTVRAKLDKDAAAAKRAADQAEAALESSRKEGAALRAQTDQLKTDLAERKKAAQSAKCSRCGQPIDKKAAKQQIDELTAQLNEAVAAASKATAAETAAQKVRVAARKSADDAVAAVSKQAQQHSRLDGDRTSTQKSREQAATALAEHESRLDGRVKDVATAQKLHDAANAKLADAESALATARDQCDAARVAEETAREALDAGKHQRAEADATAREQAATAKGHRDLAESTAAALGEIGERALEDPAVVVDALKKNQKELAEAPKRKDALDAAQKQHDDALGQRKAKQDEIDAIPAAHQVDEGAARTAAQEAQAAATSARAEHQAAQQRLTTAEAHVDELTRLHADLANAKLRHKRLSNLTKHLGKNGLQGQLVHGAITDVKNHANAFLQRLTGGMIELTLEDVKGALELRAIDHTCMRTPKSAKALSGSQKFRCAVAIASGIGQYAGAGGMRSIVIDEGFASLDFESQKGMVAELKALAEHMDKVIVVSHLDAFTDPVNFPDRLLVERNADGGSSIKRAS